MSGAEFPKNARPLVDALLAAGWSFMVAHGKDTGSSPYVSVEGKGPDSEVKCTWHTRGTGTYRLFTSIVRLPGRAWHDATLKKVLEVIA